MQALAPVSALLRREAVNRLHFAEADQPKEWLLPRTVEGNREAARRNETAVL